MLTNKTMATDSKTQDKYKSCLQCCSAIMFNIVESIYKFSAGDDVVSIYLTCVHKKTHYAFSVQNHFLVMNMNVFKYFLQVSKPCHNLVVHL